MDLPSGDQNGTLALSVPTRGCAVREFRDRSCQLPSADRAANTQPAAVSRDRWRVPAVAEVECRAFQRRNRRGDDPRLRRLAEMEKAAGYK